MKRTFFPRPTLEQVRAAELRKREMARRRERVEASRNRSRRRALPKVNLERSAREFVRCYGSVRRVKAVRAMECLVPGCHYLAENAHTEGGGMGRKADACKVANICENHHTSRNDSFHALGSARAFNRHHEVDVFASAQAIEREHPTARAA